MILWTLFKTFLLIGFVSFGGGYAMIPLIELAVSQNGWMSTQQFSDIIAVAGMSPGPIATNSAIIVGYYTSGVPGAIVSALGMILPSLSIILIIATFFYKIDRNRWVQAAFYGLRPIITGLIMYAAIRFALSNELIGLTWKHATNIAIFILALFAIWRLRWHPAFVIVLAGISGTILYG